MIQQSARLKYEPSSKPLLISVKKLCSVQGSGVHRLAPRRCRANMADVRLPRPDSGLGFQAKVFNTFQVVPSLLGSRRIRLAWQLELYPSVQFSIQEQLLRRNVKRFRGGLVSKARRPLYHSTLGSRVMMKKKKTRLQRRVGREGGVEGSDAPLPDLHQLVYIILSAKDLGFRAQALAALPPP